MADEVDVIHNVNTQCADIEDWDDKAFPLQIERVDGTPQTFATLSIDDADLLYALLAKPLKIVSSDGSIVCSPPLQDDSPGLKELASWLKGASASVKSRRSLRSPGSLRSKTP